MRTLSNTLPVAAILTLLSGVTIAATPRVDPEKLPKVECTAVRYSAEFLAKYPKAPSTCREARVYKGQTYIQLKGKVYLTDQNTPTIDVFDAYGNSRGSLTIKNPDNFKVIINHKETDFASVKKGQILTFWVPESTFGAT